MGERLPYEQTDAPWRFGCLMEQMEPLCGKYNPMQNVPFSA